MVPEIELSFQKLKAYCKEQGFKGYDPYDGLNSKVFQALPFLHKNRLARLAWIQVFKKNPINLRPILGVKKDFNPKSLGLFLSAYCNLYKLSPDDESLMWIQFFASKLEETISKGYNGACWGYNFDWQAKAFYQPRYTPTVVATSFICSAFLDAYEVTSERKYLEIARSSCDFILTDLNRTYNDQGDFSFSYSPLDKAVVFNASLLGSRALARVYHYTRENVLLDNAGKSVKFCTGYQHDNGAWNYGTLPHHQWVDNFHTGYNLECISEYMKCTGDNRFHPYLNKGLLYYLEHFFTPKGEAMYYNTSMYPIDIHAPAQLVITLSRLGKFNEHLPLIENVLDWTIHHMQSPSGYFYFQKTRFFTTRIPYMRWAQAWMFYAFSEYLLQSKSLANRN